MANEVLPFEGVFFENETIVPGGLTVDTYIDRVPTLPYGRLHRAAWFLGTGAVAFSIGGTGLHLISENPDKAAEFLRDQVGVKTTLRLEGIKFDIEDRYNQWKDKHGRVDNNPFEEEGLIIVNNLPTPDPLPTLSTITGSSNAYSEAAQFEAPPPKPRPMRLPEIRQLNSNPDINEGVWLINNLPRTTEEDIFMAKTLIKPDKSRSYANVGILLVDNRRVNLNLVGGYVDQVSGNSRGTGKIPAGDLEKTLVAFNGGFKQSHGAGGIVVNGTEFQPLVKGNATIAIMKDGTSKMGVWGQGELSERTDEMVSIRQNAYLLVSDGEITPDVLGSEIDVDRWGRILENSKEFVTWRSGIGVTPDGDYLLATGPGLTPKTLAIALEAAGAETAMQLDINHIYLQTSLLFHWSNGSTTSMRLREDMVKPDNKYFDPETRSERDFFYMILNEERYAP